MVGIRCLGCWGYFVAGGALWIEKIWMDFLVHFNTFWLPGWDSMFWGLELFCGSALWIEMCGVGVSLWSVRYFG